MINSKDKIEEKNEQEQKEKPESLSPEGVPLAPAGEVNPDLTVREIKQGVLPGDVYVRHHQPYNRLFRRVGPGHFEATPEVIKPETRFETAYKRAKSF